MNSKIFRHFGHKHLLTAIAAKEGCVHDCNVCELQILPKTPFHGCSDCNYYLHDHCINISRSILHPSHPTHPLTLLPVSNYASGGFRCNGCREVGKGISYSCSYCKFDLHVKCARLSEKVTVVKKHKHDLILQYYFFSYKNNFREYTDSNYIPLQKDKVCRCNICKGDIGNKTWKYDCRRCHFDAHVGCVVVMGDGTVVNKCGKNELLVNGVVGGENRRTAMVVSNKLYVPPKSGGELTKNDQEVYLNKLADEIMKFIVNQFNAQQQQPIFINQQRIVTNNVTKNSEISFRRLCLRILKALISGTVVNKCGKNELLVNGVVGGENRGTAMVVSNKLYVPPKSGGELTKNDQEVYLNKLADEMMKFIPNQFNAQQQQPIFINHLTINQQRITNNVTKKSKISFRKICLRFLKVLISGNFF